MNNGTNVATVTLNNKLKMDVFHKVTEKGDGFTYHIVNEDGSAGGKLKPIASIARLIEEGTFCGERLVAKKVKERFDGKLVDTVNEYVQGNVVVRTDDGRSLKITLEYRPDDLGRFVPLVKGAFLSENGGTRGRVAAAPIDEDDLF